MVRRFWHSFQFLALLLVLAGVAQAQAQDSYLLRYKLEKGKVQLVRQKSDLKVKQTVMGNDLDSTLTTSAFEQRDYGDVDTEGGARLKTKVVRMKGTGKFQGLGDLEFDSQKSDRDTSSLLGAALTPLYERLVGSELQAEVTSRGAVTSYTGYSQLVGDLVKNNPLTAQFAGGGSDAAAKLGFQGQWIVLPEKPIKAGENWENPFELDLGALGIVKGKESVTLVSVEKRDGHDIAKLSTTSDLSFDLKLDMNGTKVTGKMTTSNSTGSSEFDITAGKLLKQTSELTLSGQLTVEVNGMTIPIQQTQTISAEHELVDKLPE